MRILVIGGTGYIGGFIIRQLVGHATNWKLTRVRWEQA
jgi:uncharacterized protein YbjT (DUF2867 family)